MTQRYHRPKPELVLTEAFMRDAGQGDLVVSAQMAQSAIKALEAAGYSIMRKPNTFTEQWKIDSLVNLIGQALRSAPLTSDKASDLCNDRDYSRIQLTGADAIAALVRVLDDALAYFVPTDKHIDFTEPRDEILAKTGN
jgi:hypothetical protein